jgi:Transposase DDE domain group 1
VKTTGSRPKIVTTADGRGVVGHAGARLLADLADATGLSAAFSDALAPLRVRSTGHDPGRVAVDLAVMLADGGQTIADLVVLRNQTNLFGAVASDPTAWRVLAELDEDALSRLRHARAQARELAWAQRIETRTTLPASTAAGQPIPGLTLDLDASVVICHSEKESATPTYKKTFGYHPLFCFLDGTREALAGLLREGRAGSGRTPPPTTSPSWTRPCNRSRTPTGTAPPC